ncbi:MAG: hypothetical protein FWG68_11355 [Defluviitaleaceae bacterium]|nr:hypothetical protein [Defluviitaleaceae bacterium]
MPKKYEWQNKWKNVYHSIYNKNIPNNCPYCTSENTDYCFVYISPAIDGVVQNGFIEVWCNSCGEFDNISCRNVKEQNDFQVYTHEQYEVHRQNRQRLTEPNRKRTFRVEGIAL